MEHARLRVESRDALKRFPQVDPLVIGHNGTPFFLRGRFGKVAPSGNEASLKELRKILPDVAKVIGITPDQLRAQGDQVDSAGYRHFFFGLNLHGREIVGASLLVHVDNEGYLYMVNGTIPDEIEPVPTQEKLTRDEAKEKARVHLGKSSLKSSHERVVYFLASEDAPLHLAWQIPHDENFAGGVMTTTTFIDAVTGEHILTQEPIYDARNRSVRNADGVNATIMYDARPGGGIYRPNTVARSEGQGATSSSAVNGSYDNTGNAYDYFQARFGYDGPDNAGVTINSIANSTFVYQNPSNGTYFQTGQNSFFTKVNFGDGLKGYLYFGTGPTLTVNQATGHAAAADIAGHEYTHWILDARANGSLGSAGQTGAINEGLADVFGAMSERKKNNNVTNANTWLIGETAGGAFRNMANPTSIGTALDYYPNYNVATTDPHDGATIVGLAFKLLCTGGTHPNPTGKPSVNVPGVGESAAEQIYFHAVRNTIASGTSFSSLKHSIAESARVLYGEVTRNKVYFTFDAVGVPYNTGNFRAINISTRAWVGTGSDAMITGFVMSGSGSKPMLIRAVGPTLGNAPFNVPGTLADPLLSIYAGNALLTSNDNWEQNPYNGAAIVTTSAAVGAFALPSGSYDAAALPSLSPGA